MTAGGAIVTFGPDATRRRRSCSAQASASATSIPAWPPRPILDSQHETKEGSDAMRAMDIKMTQMGGFGWVEEMPSRDLQTNMLDQVIVRSVMGSKG